MEPLSAFPRERAAGISVVYTDIDDTLTTEGLVEPEAFDALWALFRAGIAVVPVTGRPAGWCDHIARMWPVRAVVGENGALYFCYDRARRRLERQFVLGEVERAGLRAKVALIGQEIWRAVPRAAIATDQPYRIHDLAIDFSEDVVPPLSGAEIDRVVAIFEAQGATAKVSSIHVNGWIGSWDKVTMIRRCAAEVLGLSLDDAAGQAAAVYVGDSPNDEPAFRFFSQSVGVANIRDFEQRLQHAPRYVTPSRGGRGFKELADLILAARAGR